MYCKYTLKRGEGLLLPLDYLSKLNYRRSIKASFNYPPLLLEGCRLDQISRLDS